ncbi:MAG: cation-translocating P-type ATPase [Clostridia bacterium]|nr:cation-translocating P-type ATPase [Clostridia bacterium]
MENIDNMGVNTLESLSRDNLSEQGRKKLTREIISGAAAICCLACGLIYTYVIKGTHPIVPQLLYFIGFLIEGIPVIVQAVKGVFTKNLTNAMEMLVAVAIIACVFNRDLILALLIPLILNAVHILEERSIMGGRDVIDGLKRMQQSTAILHENGEDIEVDAKTLKIGQHIKVKPGAVVPIDGVVVSGESHIDQKSLTGEPEPAHVRTGDSVYAGTVNLDGVVIVEVRREYVDTSFSKILDLLEKSESISIPESRLIDKFMGYYIPFVLAIAAAVALVTRDISKAIAILVVSCPCGYMLVSSAPMIAALGVATKCGVLIKNSKFIESLTEIDTVVFDKTGTVTKGELSLTEAHPYGVTMVPKLLKTAASVAVGSTHPVSRAVISYIGSIPFDEAPSIHEISGGGVYGQDANGRIIRFGKRAWIEESGIEIPEGFTVETTGSVSYVTVDNTLIGALCFNDTLRENVQGSIEELKNVGVEKVVMLTGDREESAKAIAEKAGVDEVFARLLPQDKLDRLKALRESEHKVLAVGDGINDALALREADVGIAMGAMGSDLAIESADIALMNNNLMNIPFVITLASKTRKIIYQNLTLSILISVLMIALSAFGVIPALAGSILHNCGAFVVLINSSRILRGKNE